MDVTRLAGRIAVLHDMREEGWPSMDQMGHLLTTRVPLFAPALEMVPVRHSLRRTVSAGPLRAVRPFFFTDRVLNRMLWYPMRVRRGVRGRFDLYHVVDHTYAQLVHALPADRTIVTCHDVDAFRSLIPGGDGERRTLGFRLMARRILRGLRRAARVVCVSESARDDLARFGLVDPARLRVVPNGVDPALLEPPTDAARARAADILPAQRGVFDVLHVGNDIPRKRLDRLVEIVATLRKRGHWIRLVRVGSPMRAATRARAAELGFTDYIELPFLDLDVLRAVYERCDVLLLTSDREGYGLPVLEAFAAGKPVIASDIPALRESTAGLGVCVPPDSLHDWVEAIERVLGTPEETARLAPVRRAHAASRTWDAHARGLLPVYAELLAAQPHAPQAGAGVHVTPAPAPASAAAADPEDDPFRPSGGSALETEVPRDAGGDDAGEGGQGAPAKTVTVSGSGQQAGAASRGRRPRRASRRR